MLRLYQHVARQLAVMAFICVCVFGASSYFVCKHIELNRYEKLLKNTINIAKISITDKQDLQRYVKDFYSAVDMRMTIMDDNGDVVADSVANASELENHNNRIEIIKARKDEFGISIRYSDTLSEDFLNVASRVLIEDTFYFVRITTSLDSIMHSFYIIWANITAIFAVVLVLGLFWISRFNKNIKRETSKLNAAFSALAEKDYKTHFAFGFAKEFAEIGVYLKKLAKRLEKRAKQKRKYTAKIKLISQQKSDIISAISHEFKNPIASVIGYAQTLNEDENIDAAIRKKFLEKILTNSQKISDMIDRLSLAAKLEGGDLSPVLSEFDFDLLVQEIIASFGISEPSRIIKYEGEATVVKADAQMMEITVTNLIHNALKYSDGDVFVRLKDRDFSVTDSGIGIAQNEIDKVTAKFYRSDSRTWDNSLGLGLAFVSYILKAHGLELKIQSVLGEGSTFSFDLT